MFLKIAVDLVAMARKTRHCVYSGSVLVNSCSWARVSISQFAGHTETESLRARAGARASLLPPSPSASSSLVGIYNPRLGQRQWCKYNNANFSRETFDRETVGFPCSLKKTHFKEIISLKTVLFVIIYKLVTNH